MFPCVCVNIFRVASEIEKPFRYFRHDFNYRVYFLWKSGIAFKIHHTCKVSLWRTSTRCVYVLRRSCIQIALMLIYVPQSEDVFGGAVQDGHLGAVLAYSSPSICWRASETNHEACCTSEIWYTYGCRYICRKCMIHEVELMSWLFIVIFNQFIYENGTTSSLLGISADFAPFRRATCCVHRFRRMRTLTYLHFPERQLVQVE